MNNSRKFLGCFFGLAIGDAYGAAFEGGPIERLVWKCIGRTKDGFLRYTDDTQMAIDVACSFIKNGEINQDQLAKTFSASYRWSRGYGPSAATLLKKIRAGKKWQELNRATFRDGSFGNGAAMRAPIVALCFPKYESKRKENIVKVAEITHAHPLAIEGAQLIAFVIASFLRGDSQLNILASLPSQCSLDVYKEKISYCRSVLEAEKLPSTKEIRRFLGNGIAASESCITAIYFGLGYSSKDIDTMLNQIFALGGDTDTIAAMAGAIWGTANGGDRLASKMRTVENSDIIIDLANRLYTTSSDR